MVSEVNIMRDIINSERNDTKQAFQVKIVSEQNLSTVIELSDAVVILTEWDMFKNINWEKLSIQREYPLLIFDGRNILKQPEKQTKYILHNLDN